MPRASGYEHLTICSRIGLAYMNVTETGRIGDCDGPSNRNEEKYRREENVGHTATMFHQVLDVSGPRVIV
jgi:hypothetical protein